MTQIKKYFLLLFWLIPFALLSQKPVDYLEIGNRYLNTNKYDSAILNYTIGIEKCANCHDTLKGLFYAQLGKSKSLIYEKEEALSDMLKALDLFESSKYSTGQARVYIYLAEYFRGIYQFEKAEQYFNKFDTLNKKTSLSLELKAYYYNRKAALIHQTNDDTSTVIMLSNKVIEISKKIEIDNYLASTYNELGYLYINNKQQNKGISYYNKALNIFEKLGDLHQYTSVLLNIIQTYSRKGEHEIANKLALQGLVLIENLELYKEKRDLHMVIHEFFLMKKNYKKALFHYKKHQENNFMVLSQEFNEKLVKINQEYDIDKEKSATVREQERAIFAEKEVDLKIQEKRILTWYLFVLGAFFVITVYLFFRLRLSKNKLSRNLEEKNILFQELHHRVKNNLTLLKSLLFLRSKASNEKEVKVILDECQARIQSMALVHQNLYDVDDASKVHLKLFIKDLLDELCSSVLSGNKTIEANVTGGDVEMDMSTGVFIGLILNELITNSMKYADPNGKTLTLVVELIVNNDELIIKYKDNGQGLPPNVSLTNNGGFGFKLIQIMMQQIDSKMDYSKTENNTLFTFSVKP